MCQHNCETRSSLTLFVLEIFQKYLRLFNFWTDFSITVIDFISVRFPKLRNSVALEIHENVNIVPNDSRMKQSKR